MLRELKEFLHSGLQSDAMLINLEVPPRLLSPSLAFSCPLWPSLAFARLAHACARLRTPAHAFPRLLTTAHAFACLLTPTHAFARLLTPSRAPAQVEIALLKQGQLAAEVREAHDRRSTTEESSMTKMALHSAEAQLAEAEAAKAAMAAELARKDAELASTTLALQQAILSQKGATEQMARAKAKK